jgi:uncharacterized protein YvpB
MEMSNQRLDLALAIAILLAVFFPILHVGAAQLPEEAYISGVVGHAQGYSLSCESRSAADWAAYWGVYIDETEFLNALPRSDDPNEGFVGNPNHSWGSVPPNSYGVHAAPVAELLRGYGLEAEAIYGMKWEQARLEIAEGRPVIVWVIGSVWAGSSQTYSSDSGDDVTVANYEHTMILIGYNDEVVHLVDALTGHTVSHSIDNFLESWAVLGNMAVIGEGAERGAAGVETYAVQSGDTLRRLAAQWGLSWQAIADWNDLAYPYTIYSGQLLYTGPLAQPEAQPNTTEVYYVQEGEHLMQIAQDLDMDWQYLAAINGLQPPYALAVGQALRLSEEGEEDEDGEAGTIEVPEFYTAWRVESLVSIANYYKLDWVVLAGLNGIDFPYSVQPGQTLRLVPEG